MEQPSLHDSHDESYFASFTDMLVGIIFIFIILLMIVANNYQAATEAVTQSNKALEEARNKARDEARDKARDEARDKAHDELYSQEIAKLKAALDAKTLEAAQALEEVKTLETAKKLQEAKALEITNSLQDPQAIEDEKAKRAAKANDDVIMRRLQDIQQNIFNDARTRVLKKIQETYARQGIAVTVNIDQGTLSIPEKFLFGPDWTPGELNYKGEQTIETLATLFAQYLPCISPTANAAMLRDCDDLAASGQEFTPSNGLDVIFIDDYPVVKSSREDKLLLSVQRTVSVFNALKRYAPYLDNKLKNIAGAPILDIKVNQERRKAQNGQQNAQQSNSALQNHVVLRFVMRKPNAQDILKLRNSYEEAQ